MPFDSQSQPPATQYEAYVCTDEGAALAREVVASNPAGKGGVHGGGLSAAARLDASAFTAGTLIVEMGQIPLSLACECVAELRGMELDVIVLGQPADLATYRALRTAGALDYFPFPVTATDILSVDVAAPVETPAASTDVAVPSIAVVGCKGGVGASLLAQSLAVHAASARGAGLRTALIDADLEFGTQAIDLDRNDTRGFFDALSAPDRVDETFIGATMEKLNTQLSLYSAQVAGGQDNIALENGLDRLLPRMRAQFGALVTDLPRSLVLRQPGLLSHFDAVALVMPAGFAGVNAASRLITELSQEAPGVRILPVLSEVRTDARLPHKDVIKALERPLTATLPRNDKAIARAQRLAKPLLDLSPKGAWAKAVARIWEGATAAKTQEKPKRKGLFG